MGNPTEIHTLTPSGELQPLALASAKLTVPFHSATSAQAAERVRSSTDVRDRERKISADSRINGAGAPSRAVSAVAALSMAKTQSSPNVSTSPSVSTTPVIPLKTRVVQLLAMGSCPQTDIVTRLKGLEADIMRVVNVVSPDYILEHSIVVPY